MRFLLIFVLLTSASACAASSESDNGEQDAGTIASGGDSDTHTDTDTDTGGDTDTDTDTDGDTDADTDADTDSDSDPIDDLCDVGVYTGNTPQVLNTRNFGVHDPTMIEENGTFYLLWTGHFIPVATSSDLLTWRSTGTIYNNDYPSWSDTWLAGIPREEFNFPWAPDVAYFGGRYHIYSTFSAVFGDNISCITHLTADTMAGPWTDHGPLVCTDGSESYNAIDADVEIDENGTPWLAFGSFWDGIMAFELDSNGDRVGTEMTRLAWNSSIEAPVLFRRCGYYYLFVSFDVCCQGTRSTYNVRVGRSENIMGPYYDRTGIPMLNGGGTLMVEGDHVKYAAAGHSEVIVANDMIYHFYHAYRQDNGASVLRIVEMLFDEDDWPVPAGP